MADHLEPDDVAPSNAIHGKRTRRRRLGAAGSEPEAGGRRTSTAESDISICPLSPLLSVFVRTKEQRGTLERAKALAFIRRAPFDFLWACAHLWARPWAAAPATYLRFELYPRGIWFVPAVEERQKL